MTEMLVTPELAQSWLANRAPFQRSISQSTVSKYATDMRKGAWQFVPNLVISLTPDGFILDGQHRLSAVVQSGIAQRFMVYFDGDRSHFSVIDRGRVRSPIQLAAMADCEFNLGYHVSAVNALLWTPAVATSFKDSSWQSEIGEVLHYFAPELAVVFPPGIPGGSNFRHGALRGALLRMAIAYPNDHRKIQDFLEILTSGNSNPDYSHPLNNMVLTFHTKYLTLKGKQDGSKPRSYSVKRWVWSQTLESCRRFIANKPKKALIRTDRLPSEREAETLIWLDNKPPQMLFKPFVQSLFRNNPNPVFNGVPIRPLPPQIQ